MSGFSPDWLELREPFDHAARSTVVAAALQRHFAHRETIRVVDLGAGTASNLRYSFRLLPAHQHWRLIDNDPALIERARDVLKQWADDVEEPQQDGDLILIREGRRIEVSFEEIDLAADLARALSGDVDLVTTAALLDLASDDFLASLVELMVVRRVPLYAALIYNGKTQFLPKDKHDEAILAAFHRHMESDKGFGPALGPTSPERLHGRLEREDYTVVEGSSPWEVQVSDTLAHELATGIAQAAAETVNLSADDIDSWLDRRLDQGIWKIGHTDLFAAPIK